MKQVFSTNIAIVDGETIEYPSMIFTEDNIDVNTFISRELLLAFVENERVNRNTISTDSEDGQIHALYTDSEDGTPELILINSEDT